MQKKSSDVAIIGMGCIFPKANGLKQYWRLLFNGEDAIDDIPAETHWALSDYYDEDPATPDHTYCRRGGFIPAVTFDPIRFGLPPSNLTATDTSQLLGLLVAEMALDDAGYSSDTSFDRERTNIILGVTGTQELVIPLGARLGHPIWKKALKDSGISPEKSSEIVRRISAGYPQWQENSFPGLLGNVVAGRIANRLDLGGTNAVVDAACASSLGAVNTAVMELLSGRCNMSVTGGVDTLNDIFMHMCFSKTGVLSHTSDARPFSKDADGTVLGEGIGMLVLKRLEDAERDKNRIYAVIKGIGTSSDGKTGGIYAPDAQGQLRALKAAYEQAGIDPGTVELIEAHGTGTRVGDKIEFTALRNLISGSSSAHPCALGSVKSMIGHTKAAAGAAGLIKAALSLHHKVIPPTLKADVPDPDLAISETPFYLNSRSRPWVSSETHPRRSGVSAFGFGGSNFHAVLQEYRPAKQSPSWDGSLHIAAFSSPDKPGLVSAVTRFSKDAALQNDHDHQERSAAVARHSEASRQSFQPRDRYRLLMLIPEGQNPSDIARSALEALGSRQESAWNDRNIYFSSAPPKTSLGFLFPGQGSQYTHMGNDIMSVFPEALEALALAEKAFAEKRGTGNTTRLSRFLFPLPDHVQEKAAAEEQLRATDIAQPAIGAVSLAMTKVLQRFNIKPSATCGHSFGELAALNAAGWIDDITFARLGTARGAFMADVPGTSADPGSMLAVKAPLADIEQLVEQEQLDLVLANRNSHDQGVLSGSTPEIDRARTLCKKRKLRAVKLPVAAAFHSPFVESAAEPFQKYLETAAISPTAIPVYSNTTGEPYPDSVETIKPILGRQLSNPVNFVTDIETMVGNGVDLFLEVGPRTVLSDLTRTIIDADTHPVVAMDRSSGKASGLYDLAHVICSLASAGYPVDLTQWEESPGNSVNKRMRLPIAGANAKPMPDTSLPPAQAPEPAGQNNEPARRQTEPAAPPIPPHSPMPEAQPAPHEYQKITGSDPMSSHTEQQTITSARQPVTGHNLSLIHDAMKMVQKGLESMEALQAQTARAHEKFLETQSSASRTLQAMMEQTREFSRSITQIPAIFPETGQPLQGHPGTGESRPMGGRQPFESPKTATAEPPFRHQIPESEPPLQVPDATASRNRAADTSSTPPMQTPAVPQPGPEETTMPLLLDVVSRLTGFPVEMLEPDMDIESDLGIDSIKRVEIVSELEKQLPDTSALTPDAMGRLKTLRDICNAISPSGTDLKSTSSYSAQPVSGSHDRQARLQPSAAGPATSGSAMPLLLDVVSRLTGFPVEMLEPDMDIESDLGIDSIKRVEIVSELEKQLPDTSALTPDAMGRLKTLRDICNAIDPPASGPVSTAVTPAGIVHGKPETRTASPGTYPSGGAPADPETIMTALVTIIADLTGFPVEMLEPDMDIESDLGIDSIKRVEILSRLEQDLPLTSVITPDQMGQLKTLGQLRDQLADSMKPHISENQDEIKPATPGPLPGAPDTSLSAPLPAKEPVRQIVTLKTCSIDHVRFHNGAKISIPEKRTIYIIGETAGLAGNMLAEFKKGGAHAVILDMDQALDRDTSDAGGLVIIADRTRLKNAGTVADYLTSAFLVARKNGPFLKSSAREGGGFFATVSFLGGTFGFDSPQVHAPAQGGLAGLVKTAALEWEDVLCRSLDLPWKETAIREYSEAAAALCMIHGPVEMGLKGQDCLIPELVPAAIQGRIPALDSSDVIVITGGARGVTAECAIALANAYRPTIVLLGRSEPPVDEPEWLTGCTSEPEMKKAILTHAFDKRRPSPVDLEAAFRKLSANREITRTLAGIRAAGGTAEYLSADVRDAKQMGGVFSSIRSTHGSITALIHGAGVLEDRLILDKDPGQFSRVFGTKVKGLHALLRASKKDQLKFLVLFSSVAARTGNKGQVDYAMANEVLNKTAQALTGSSHIKRALSINWGPWEGGMVTPSLKREFARNQIDLIPLESGARCLIRELEDPAACPAEIIIGASLPSKQKPKPHLARERKPRSTMVTTVETRSGVNASPVLKSHMIAGEPVVPFALYLEWYAHAAEHANPGLVFTGLDQMRLLKGIRPGTDDVEVMIRTGKCTPCSTGFSIDGEISTFGQDRTSFLNSGATLLLDNSLPLPPVHAPSASLDLKPCSLTPETAYSRVLFHGSDLQAIKGITGCSPKGIEVIATRAPRPEQWLEAPLRSQWVMDPMVMDAAFQAAILWCYETSGQVCLPSYIANLRVYRSFASTRGDVRIILTVNEHTRHAVKGYFTFLDQDRNVLASITGFEAVIDPSLLEKFKPRTQETKQDRHPTFTREQILAFAQGSPSLAFGDRYRIFDSQREIARLPRPPYFFMDRVVAADAPQWEMVPGGWIQAEFDLPDDAWYFTAGRTRSLPFCILLEIALQPCGWLAAYAGSALRSDQRLYFRNLGGEATLFRPIANDSGTLTMRSRMSRVSEAGGLIIQEFDMEVLDKETCVYAGHTSFGFFTSEALSNQQGIKNSRLKEFTPTPDELEGSISMEFNDDAPLTPDDTRSDPDTGMPSKALRMIDRVDQLIPEGGIYRKGFIKGSKTVDPDEWFFKAHFYQDPVCPGSLGVESFLQLLTAFALNRWDYSPESHQLELTRDHTHKWIYRGQVIPSNSHIEIMAHVKEIQDTGTPSIVADGILLVDGLCIYQMEEFSVSLVPVTDDRPKETGDSYRQRQL